MPVIPVKRDFSKFLEEQLFKTYQCARKNLYNTEISLITILINDLTTDTLPAISNILATFTENIRGKVSFLYSYR